MPLGRRIDAHSAYYLILNALFNDRITPAPFVMLLRHSYRPDTGNLVIVETLDLREARETRRVARGPE